MSTTPWFVYILRCSDGSYYTGITQDIKKRMKMHNSGNGAKYTKSRTPVVLEYFETLPSKNSALSREYRIKRLSRKDKILMIRTSDSTHLTDVQ